MSVPIIAPVSISLIERMEIDLNITEATYLEKRGAVGRLHISPKITEKDFEDFRNELSQSSNPANRELSLLKKSPYSQYAFLFNPPKTFLRHLFSRPSPQREGEVGFLFGYLLIGGTETVNYTEEAPTVSKGVVPLSFTSKEISRGIFAEIDRMAPKEVHRKFSYDVNIEKILQLVENNPEIQKIQFATKQRFEIREPISLEPSVREAVYEIEYLDSKGPKWEIERRLAEKDRDLRRQGVTGLEWEKQYSEYKMELLDKMRTDLRRSEKFFGMVDLSLSLENISRGHLSGDIYVAEFAITFPIAFSKYYMFPSNVRHRYDPVRMQAIWSDFWLPLPRRIEREGEEKEEEEENKIRLDILLPHEELSKVQKISGEIRMRLMARGQEGPPLVSLIYLQQICDPRGIPITKELERLGLFTMETGATCSTQFDARSIYLRPIYDTQRRMEFENVHPKKAYELVRSIFNALSLEIVYEEEPREISRPGQEEIREFYVRLRGRKLFDVTPFYIDTVVEGRAFLTHEERTSGTKTLKTRLKKILKEHGNTRITLLGSSSNLEILNNFMDQLRDDIKNQIVSIS